MGAQLLIELYRYHDCVNDSSLPISHSHSPGRLVRHIYSRMSENIGSEGNKRRLQNACDGCRRRKGAFSDLSSLENCADFNLMTCTVKCDSANIPGSVCSRCQDAKIECTHNLQKKVRASLGGTGAFRTNVCVQKRGPRVG